MTRQRLREASINWETILSIESFSQKVVKKIETLAFTEKTKIIKAYIPEKVKLYIDTILAKEINYFQKKYLFKIDLIANSKLIIPEFKIELLNKSKKVLNTIERIKKINEVENIKFAEKSEKRKDKKDEKKKTVKLKGKSKKNIAPKTLWVRRKKAS